MNRVVPALALVVGTTALALLPGCGRPPATRKSEGGDGAAAVVRPWEAAGKRLRKEPDAAGTKTALALLNTDLQAAQDAPRPAAATPESLAAVAALVPLNDADQAVLRESAYTVGDAAYLAECLFLRDAARSLEVPPKVGATPDQAAATAADRAFAWVCRSIYLNSWTAPVPGQPGVRQAMPPVPPTYALRRGYGSGLERMYVFLAVLQQMGLDGCLVGPPEAKDQPAMFAAFAADKKTLLTGTPRGPFWAVGVRVGGDVRLYDPWRGAAFPATLAALKANPDAHKAWFEARENAGGVTAEEAKGATAFLAVPVPALAPRIATLEQQLKGELPVRLAVDPVSLRNAFQDPKPAYWNPPGDPFAYGRVLRTFLPVDEGGTDRNPPGGRLTDQYTRSQLPSEVLTIPAELRGNDEAAERVRALMAQAYAVAFFNPSNPNPRERIERGQFQDAAVDLVTRQDQFGYGLERLRNNQRAEPEIRAWAEAARELYDQQGLAATPEARQAAAAAVEDHWKRNGQLVQLMIDRVTAELGHAEATFLLALCKHEQAERVQARLEAATGPGAELLKRDATDAWKAAVGEWQTYAERAAVQARFPGRADHVKALTARAEALANAK
ncbi:hypothetical protein [Gemmata sp.]|uniref:hypothetical protein n=1 Tax=Gemmata sp. TaxID=1914242 RepID=UPI003F70CA48